MDHGTLIFYTLQVMNWCMTVAKTYPMKFISDLVNSTQIGPIRIFCLLEYIWFGSVRTFCFGSVWNTLYSGVIRTFCPNYILLARKINTFWSGSISRIRNITSSCAELFLIYILGQNVSKNKKRKILNCIKSLCTKLF